MQRPLTESQKRTFESLDLRGVRENERRKRGEKSEGSYPLTMRFPRGLNITDEMESEWPESEQRLAKVEVTARRDKPRTYP